MIELMTTVQAAALNERIGGGTLAFLGGDGPLPAMLMAAGAMLLLFLMVMNMRAKLQRREREQVTPRERVERIKQTHGMKNDLREMMVELEDLTRRFSAQLDAKALRLEKLIDQADERIARLEEAEADAQTYRAHVQPPPASTLTEPVEEVTPSNAPGDAPSQAVPDQPAVAAEADDEPDASGQDGIDPLTRQVYELSDSGHDATHIARTVGEHIGKVELILALRD